MTATELARLGQPVIDGADPQPDDLRCWSVTTIIGVLDKPALVYWSAQETARAAVRDVDVWQALVRRDPDDAVEWLTGARFRRQPGARSATELGSAVHAACEEYALTGTRPDVDDECRPFLDSFDRWLDRFTPSYQATEVAVYSPTWGYAGQADAFLTVDGVRFIADYKTSREHVDRRGKPRRPYPEVALQLAAYRYAELAAVWRPRRIEAYRRRYYLLSPAERELAVPVPEVDGGLCLHITPVACEAFPVRCDRRVHEAFLYAQECFRWQQEAADAVAAHPLEPGAVTA